MPGATQQAKNSSSASTDVSFRLSENAIHDLMALAEPDNPLTNVFGMRNCRGRDQLESVRMYHSLPAIIVYLFISEEGCGTAWTLSSWSLFYNEATHVAVREELHKSKLILNKEVNNVYS
jgi:hypothetical protein